MCMKHNNNVFFFSFSEILTAIGQNMNKLPKCRLHKNEEQMPQAGM